MAGGIGLSGFVSARRVHAELERRLQVDSEDPVVSESEWALKESIDDGRDELAAAVALLAEALEFLDVELVERDELVYRRRDLVRRVRRAVSP